jgi:hypothetical protein
MTDAGSCNRRIFLRCTDAGGTISSVGLKYELCHRGSWGGQRPSVGGYVTRTEGHEGGRPPPEGANVAFL